MKTPRRFYWLRRDDVCRVLTGDGMMLEMSRSLTSHQWTRPVVSCSAKARMGKREARRFAQRMEQLVQYGEWLWKTRNRK